MATDATATSASRALDLLVPRWHWRNSATLWVAAAPPEVFLAAEQVTLAELPGTATLRARESHNRRLGITVIHDLLTQGFFLLHEQPDRELVLGRVGQFWRAGGTAPAHVGGRTTFQSFNEPGYAKAALSLRADPGAGGSMVRIETRLLATDDKTFAEFNRYWLVGAWANPTARRQLLHAIRARVERDSAV